MAKKKHGQKDEIGEESDVTEASDAQAATDEPGPNMSKEEALGLIGEGAPPEPETGPLVEQSAPVESYPVDSALWAPVNAAFCELCKRYGLPKGHQSVAFDRQTGSFVVRDRPVE